MKRMNFSSGAPWEDMAGYSRAVRIGNVVEVSGTVAVNEKGEVVGKGDGYLQAQFILLKIEKALIEAGAALKDVVRTRMFVTDISCFEDFARAHGEIFSSIRPCTSLIEVKALVNQELLIEIEATAIITDKENV